jgi:hypothetical protein
MPGILYLETDFISSLNDYRKRKKTPENGYLDSSRLLQYHFRSSRRTGPHCFTLAPTIPNSWDIERRLGTRYSTCHRDRDGHMTDRQTGTERQAGRQTDRRTEKLNHEKSSMKCEQRNRCRKILPNT